MDTSDFLRTYEEAQLALKRESEAQNDVSLPEIVTRKNDATNEYLSSFMGPQVVPSKQATDCINRCHGTAIFRSNS